MLILFWLHKSFKSSSKTFACHTASHALASGRFAPHQFFQNGMLKLWDSYPFDLTRSFGEGRGETFK